MLEYTAKYIGKENSMYPFLKKGYQYRIVIQNKNETGTNTSFIYVWIGRKYTKIPFFVNDYLDKNWELLA